MNAKNLIESAKANITLGFTVVVIPSLVLLSSGFSFFIAHNWNGPKFFVWLAAFSLATTVLTFVMTGIVFKLLSYFKFRIQRDQLFCVGILIAISWNFFRQADDIFHICIIFVGSSFFLWTIFSNPKIYKTFLSASLFTTVAAFVYISFQFKPIFMQVGVQSHADEVEYWEPDVKNVFLIIYDEFPSLYFDDLDRAGISDILLPNIAKFADEATYYPNTRGVSTNTIRAVPSILTGRRPIDVPAILQNYPDSLFTILSPTFDVVGYEPYTRICPSNVCQRPQPPDHFREEGKKILFGVDISNILIGVVDTVVVVLNAVFPPGLIPEFVPSLDGKWINFSAINLDSLTQEDLQPWAKLAVDQRVDQTAFTDTIRDRNSPDYQQSPTFWFLHWNPPHAHEYYPNGEKYSRSQKYQLDALGENKTALKVRLQQLWLQFKYMDQKFGEFVQSLKEKDIWESSLIVFTSDHGMSVLDDRRGQNFRSPDSPSVAHLSWLHTMYVPLIVKYPYQEAGLIDSRQASLLDITPTILEAVGYPDIEVTDRDGNSLLVKEDEWVPTPTYWDYLPATAEELGISIKKPVLTDTSWPWDSTTFRGASFEEYLFGGEHPGDEYQEQSPATKKVGGHFRVADRNLEGTYSWLFVDGTLLPSEEVTPDAFVVMKTAFRFCGDLAVSSLGSEPYLPPGRLKVSGFISRSCVADLRQGRIKAYLSQSKKSLVPISYSLEGF